MNARTTTVAALAAVLLLAGCGDTTSSTSAKTSAFGIAKAWVIQTPDGGAVTCVSWKAGYAGGLDCDWGGTR